MHHIRISPDGRQIVFDGHDETGSPLWVQKLDSLGSPIAQRLDGTDPGGRAFWSPDSRFIGVLAEGKLKKIDPSGGPAVSLADVPDGGAGTWNRQGTILFSERRGPIHRVSAAGGEATAITELDQSRQEASHRHPYYFLPDGRHFLYVAWTKVREDTRIYVGSLDSKERKFLVNTSLWSRVAYSPPGYLLFVRGETLIAQRFDVNRLEVSGEPFPIAGQMGRVSSFSVSKNGVLAYQTVSRNGQLVWRDRSGKLLGTVVEPGGYLHIDLSRDEKRVAVARKEGASGLDVWLLELSTGIVSRFTFDPTADANPNWSPDRRHLAFQSSRNGSPSLFQKTVGGSEPELLFESEFAKSPKAWSKDGDILFLSQKAKGSSLYAFRLGEEGKGEPRVLLEDSRGKTVSDSLRMKNGSRTTPLSSGDRKCS